MEEREMREFSWSIFFCVTAVSFFIFSVALDLLDASRSGLFLKIGLVLGGLGILSFLNTWLGDRAGKSSVSSKQQQELL
ncbi:MAG TPA: hypothetical protein VF476_07700 [Chitinophagaceae bacterium]